MYNIIYGTSCQSRFDARYWMLGVGALGRPRGVVWGGRREEGSGWGSHVYLWRIHFDIWQNQYNIVKFKKKTKNKQKNPVNPYIMVKRSEISFSLRSRLRQERPSTYQKHLSNCDNQNCLQTDCQMSLRGGNHPQLRITVLEVSVNAVR